MTQSPDTPRTPPATALLRHLLPDGASHFDWFIEDRPAQALRSFRLQLDPLLPVPGGAEGLTAQAAPDHRLTYLDFEGELSAGRGRVTRVWRHHIRTLFLGRRFIRLQISTPDGLLELRGRLLQGDLWMFRHRTSARPHSQD